MIDEGQATSISYIIPVLNGERYVDGCLESITSQLKSTDQIIIVDNGSTDKTVEMAGRFRHVSIIHSPGSTISSLRNKGATQATGALLAFIDIDCVIQHGWREAAVAVLRDKSVHATGASYDLPEHPTWIENAWWPSKQHEATKAHFLVGGNFVIRNETFKKIGGFDESLITDEDYDIGERLNNQGYVIIADPRVSVVHLGNPRTIKEFVTKEKWHSTSLLETMKKHGLDKPMIMTFVFMVVSLFSLLAALHGIFQDYHSLMLVPIILFVPIMTAMYQALRSRKFRYFLHLILLYLLFYIVRSKTIIDAFIKRPAIR